MLSFNLYHFLISLKKYPLFLHVGAGRRALLEVGLVFH